VKRLEVALPDRTYPILIGSGLLKQTSEWLPYLPANSIAVVTDSNVAKHYLPTVQAALSEKTVLPIELTPGEANKTLTQCELIISKLLEAKFGRDAMIIALGGGVVGDMAGFAASLYQRGIDFIQMPTTLLAMVDSSVGGKTGVNHPLGKNMMGAFYQPKAVIIDIDTLKTLPDREYAAGLAEVLKYGLIWDADFFEYLRAHQSDLKARHDQCLIDVIARCCEIKADIVAQDEREKGLRAILNFGHTFGHAIEAVTEYKQYLHGEAISIGMCLALKLGVRLKQIPESLLEHTQAWLKAFHLPISLPEGVDPESIWQAMQQDKKREEDQLRLILLEHCGHAIIAKNIEHQTIYNILFS